MKLLEKEACLEILLPLKASLRSGFALVILFIATLCVLGRGRGKNSVVVGPPSDTMV